jgi:hypothetical protein
MVRRSEQKRLTSEQEQVCGLLTISSDLCVSCSLSSELAYFLTTSSRPRIVTATPIPEATMSYPSKQAVFEDLWEQMEELSKSCDKADGKLSRAIARQLVSYNDLPKSYRIRAHMALTSVLCAQDTFRDAEKDYAEVQARVSAGLHAHLQAELHAELRAIREAYEKDAAEECTANLQDEFIENMTAATQLSAGSQEDPIDLTLEDDSDTSDNTSDNSFIDSGYEEATDVLSARFSLPPDSMVFLSAYPRMEALLTAVPAFLFIRPSTIPLIPTLMTLQMTTRRHANQRWAVGTACIRSPSKKTYRPCQ